MSAGVAGSTAARNYAETLLALANKAHDASGWGTLIRQVADAISGDVTLQRFLESPRIPAAQKTAMLTRAFGDRVPATFLRFLQALVRNRRQTLVPAIANEYDELLDASQGIVHARVRVAHAASDADRESIAVQLSAIVGKKVVPHMEVAPELLGGMVVRIGDTVMDGSLQRKLGMLRRQMENRR
jgi:F-type H+-transporting ATPase subunit delta